MTTSANRNDNSVTQNLVEDWMDVHGIGVISNGTDNNLLLLATHDGLFKKSNNDNNSSSLTR